MRFRKEHSSESPRLDTEVLLAEALGCPRIQLYTSFDALPSDEVRTRFRELVRQRSEGTPVAYLVGRREFYSLTFRVTPDVLIPRPETEFLVIGLLDLAKQRPADEALAICDVGTGSGIVAVAAAKYLPQARVPAVDVSLAALKVARGNAVTHGVNERIEFVQSDLLTALPAEMPPICVVQHIPPYFSKAFADRLNSLCALHVKEAEEGDIAAPGTVLVAPGDFHMVVNWRGSGYQVSLKKGPMVWHQRPAVDILFKTAADVAGKFAVGAIFTGMGKDGAEGLLQLKDKGAHTIAQDEASCVVYGMPKAAVQLGAAQRVLPLTSIADALREAVLARPAAGG